MGFGFEDLTSGLSDLFSSDAIGTVADVAGVATTGIPWGTVASLGSSAISGGLGFLGTSQTNSANTANAQWTSQQNAVEAQKNRDFQERMSNTSYQRAVKDLEAAGLNPMLAYQNGGANTPSGAVGMAVQAAPMQNKLAPVGEAVGSAASKAVALQNMQEQNNNLRASSAQAVSTARLNDANAVKATAEAGRVKADTDLSIARALTEAALTSRHKQESSTSSALEAESNARRRNLEYESVGKQKEAELDASWYGTFRRILRDLTPAANTAIRAYH